MIVNGYTIAPGADLTGASLTEANLAGASLTGASLRWADLRWAYLRRTDFTGADLREADLRRADLRWANFTEADLRWANFTEADLTGADLSRALLPHFGDMRFIKTLQIGYYPVAYTHNTLRIGCQQHSIKLWCEAEQFLSRADVQLLQKHMPFLLELIERYPADKPEIIKDEGA